MSQPLEWGEIEGIEVSCFHINCGSIRVKENGSVIVRIAVIIEQEIALLRAWYSSPGH
jgi:hypothetical protein